MAQWEQGEPEFLPFGVPHRFVVYDATLRVLLLVERPPESQEPPYGYNTGGLDAGQVGTEEWNGAWWWIYVPRPPEHV